MNFISKEASMEELLLETFFSVYGKIIPIFKAYRREIRNISVTQKPDKTLLTEADIAIQKVIIEVLIGSGLDANIIAEETNDFGGFDCAKEYTWIVDPIDGTAQFVDSSSTEFCTAICLLKNGHPIAATIIIPEVLFQNAPLQLSCLAGSGSFFVGQESFLPALPKSNCISATRSKGSSPHPFEGVLNQAFSLKNRTTSQTLDLLRTAIDLSDYNLEQSFCMFYRQNQKIWDGAPGICFNLAMGNTVVDANQSNVIPYPVELLSKQSPTSDVVIVCPKSFLDKYKEVF